VSNQLCDWIMRMAPGVALVLALQVTVLGQRPYFDTPPPGSGPTPMAAYGQSGGCSEEPAVFHRCAMEKATQFNPPRTSDGKPDLQGFWSRIAARNAENIQEHPQGMDGNGGKSLIMDPADGRIPYQPWAAAKVLEHFPNYLNPVQVCFPDTPPKQAYGAGIFRILQTPGNVLVLGDLAHTYRVIPTDGRPHVGPDLHLFMGDSRGRWEGNTLVVDVTNAKDLVWLDHVGNFFSDNVHVVERWTMFDKDVIHYEARIEDPKVYTRPWTMALGWKRNTEPNYEMWENACWEGVSQGGLERVEHGLKPYRGAFR
jgi:hypothetical protein